MHTPEAVAEDRRKPAKRLTPNDTKPLMEGGRLLPVAILFVRGFLVDLIGIEPMTSSMPWKRAPSCATGPLIREDLPILADASWQVKPLPRNKGVRLGV
jgi:hypothetical protein